MTPVTKVLIQRFGRNSVFAKKHLGEFEDLQRIRNYFSSVLLAVARNWFGTDDFLRCEELAISRNFGEKAFNEKESVFQDIPEPDEIADHFGPFYVHLIPPKMRQALGEFYTPDWLAEKLLDFALLDEPENTTVFQPHVGRAVSMKPPIRYNPAINDRHKTDSKHVMRNGGTDHNTAVSSRPPYLLQHPLSILDPACGSGVFLLAAIKKFQELGYEQERILASFCGFDKNPTAVLAARLNLATALFLKQKNRNIPQIPIMLGDSLLDDLPSKKYSLILGNPPWINWDRLTLFERGELRELWKEYGLFNLSGKEARYGGAKKEFASLFLLRNADRFLADGGRIAMVVPRSVFQTIRSGTGFRRFEIGSKELPLFKNTPLKVLRVDDFSAIRVFSGVSTKTATIVLEKGNATTYPVPYYLWKSRTESTRATAIASDPANRLSAWRIETEPSSLPETPKITQKHQAYLGANTGGANGVFWLEVLDSPAKNLVRVRNCPQFGKRKVPQIEFVLESALVYPLLRWKDVDRFQIQTPSLAILLPQDVDRRVGIAEKTMRSRYPKTLEFLRLFESELRERAAFRKYFRPGDPFYSMYNVGPQTLAPIKVVWRRMDSKLRAALVEPMQHPILGKRPIVPQETTVILPCETREQGLRFVEILNSPETEAKIAATSAVGTKGFGSPGILQYIDFEQQPRT